MWETVQMEQDESRRAHPRPAGLKWLNSQSNAQNLAGWRSWQKDREAGEAAGVVQRFVFAVRGISYDTKDVQQCKILLREIGRQKFDSIELKKLVSGLKAQNILKDCEASVLQAALEVMNLMKLRRQGKGVWARCLLFLDDKLVCQTKRHSNGNNGLIKNADIFGNTRLGIETKISSNDAEVWALYEANEIFPPKIIDYNKNSQKWPRIKFMIITNVGPCDGCKERILAFANQICKCIPKSQSIMIVCFYGGDRYRNTRRYTYKGEVGTTYGYAEKSLKKFGGGYEKSGIY